MCRKWASLETAKGEFLSSVWDTKGSPFKVWLLGCTDNHLRKRAALQQDINGEFIPGCGYTPWTYSKCFLPAQLPGELFPCRTGLRWHFGQLGLNMPNLLRAKLGFSNLQFLVSSQQNLRASMKLHFSWNTLVHLYSHAIYGRRQQQGGGWSDDRSESPVQE